MNDRMNLVLDFKLGDEFQRLFEVFGFHVLWSADPKMLEEMIQPGRVDVAINYQYGREDYDLRDLVWRKDKNVPVLLALNWDGQLPPNYGKEGFAGTVKVPFDIEELGEVLSGILPDAKRKILNSILDLR